MKLSKVARLSANHTKTAIQVDDLTLHYRNKAVLSDTSFSIPEGKAVAIVGPNGAGKSTLLKGMMQLVPSSCGRVRFFGDKLQNKRLAVAYVPQREEIDWDFPISVFDVVANGSLRPPVNV